MAESSTSGLEMDPQAVDAFRMAYADVETKDAIPLIVADIEARRAAGEPYVAGTGPDRLKILEDMHAAGRIDGREYEAQKRRLLAPPKGRWAGWWWKGPVLLLLIFLLWPWGTPGGFPTCEARTSRDLVRQAIEEGEDAPTRRTRMLALDEVRELSHDPKTLQRYCSGLAALNSGERRIVWRLYQRGNNLFVEVSGS